MAAAMNQGVPEGPAAGGMPAPQKYDDGETLAEAKKAEAAEEGQEVID